MILEVFILPKNFLYIGIIFLLSSFMFLGCSLNQENNTEKQDMHASYNVIDARGKEIKLTEKPKRIAAYAIYGDDMLLEMVDHKRIVAMDKWVHDKNVSMATEYAKDIKGRFELNSESVIKLQPDLIIMIDHFGMEKINALERLGIPVYVLGKVDSLSDIPKRIKELGDVVGEKEKAEQMIAKFNEELQECKKLANISPREKKSALAILRLGPIGGIGTIYHEILEASGLQDAYTFVRKEKVTARGTAMMLTQEEMLRANPDIFIVAEGTPKGKYKGSQAQLDKFYSNPALKDMKAIKNKTAYIVPQCYVNSSSQHVTKAIRRLHAIVYGK